MGLNYVGLGGSNLLGTVAKMKILGRYVLFYEIGCEFC